MSDYGVLYRACRDVWRWCLTGVLLCIVLLVACRPGAMAQANVRPRTPLLPTTFRQHGSAGYLVSNQRYALAASAELSTPGVLFDDSKHQQVSVGQPGCVPSDSQIEGGVIVFRCVQSATAAPLLYRITTRTWRPVPVNPFISDPCSGAPYCGVALDPTAAGTDWIEFSRGACPGGEHCVFSNVFQNLQTGAVAQDPAVQGGNREADLNSPQLARRICRPLTVPKGFNIFAAPGPGDLRFEGAFALATSPGPQGGSETYLGRCGTHLHQLVMSNSSSTNPGPIAAAPHAIVWQQRELTLEYLPSRRRFGLRLPRSVTAGPAALALTDSRLYAIDHTGKLWITPLPMLPRRRHSPTIRPRRRSHIPAGEHTSQPAQ
ncbi:MAG: hypothetical protein ABI355_15855 [Solirubrobacteraceae bacterium]